MFAPRMTAPYAVPSRFNTQAQGTAFGGINLPEPTLYQQPRLLFNYRQKLRGGGAGYSAPYRGSGGSPRRAAFHAPTSHLHMPFPSADPNDPAYHQERLEELAPAAEVATSELNSAIPAAAAERPTKQHVANTKEKTPMCLINELARFNKVQHQYCLTDEQGPAHKKTFFVKLKLGDEEFAASGASIKKAQHAAAGVALEQTKHQHPPPKQRPSNSIASSAPQVDGTNSSVTPTVELNALAMKRGELAVYRPFERKLAPAAAAAASGVDASTGVAPSFYNPPPQTLDYRGGYYNQRYRYPKPPHRFYVALKVGEREFIGEGETMQAARHNAASMALKLLQTLPMPTREPISEARNTEGSTEENNVGKVTGNELLKSEISIVHEIALKRNYTVEFEIVKESGPPHMRTFVTRCKCGPLVTDGEGSSKKLSKKVSAEKMVVELRKLSPLPPPPPSTKPKKSATKPKQSKNLIKNIAGLSTVGMNPISRLIQIQQAKKEKEPTFSLIAENGAPRCCEFVIQVTVGDSVCTGVGPNKKLGKRNAAEQMLQMLGYSLVPPAPAKPALKTSTTTAAAAGADAVDAPSAPVTPAVSGNGDKRVTFVDHDPNAVPSAPRSPLAVNGERKPSDAELAKGLTVMANQQMISPGNSTAVGGGPQPVPCPVRTLDQLMYLAKVMNFEVQATNFPKQDSNKLEFISMVTLCTNPPQFYNGTGPTADAAVDCAALAALRKLSEVGLDTTLNGGGGGGGGGVGASPPLGLQANTAPVAVTNRSPRTRPDRPVISTVVSVKKEVK
jgi:double-stranded RNA-binding protein Staufen